ncbi:MAG: DUF2911 domain-containing protein [Bacteroidota bacterium]
MPSKLPIALLFTCFLYPCIMWGQETRFPSLSPEGRISQQAGFTEVSVRYERPAARGRVLFGGLVPWNEVWRTGAGYSTLISFSREVKVGGQQVPPGKYALFTIPTPASWTIILNRDTSLYGAYGYQSEKDVARFKVPVVHPDRYYESLTIELDFVPNDLQLYLSWGHTQVSFLIDTRADEEIHTYIAEKLASGEVEDAEMLNDAADYLLFKRENLLQALQLAEKAQALNPMSGFAVRLQVDLHRYLGHYERALELIEAGKAITRKRELPTEKDRQDELAGWDQQAEEIRKERDTRY